MPIGNEQLFDFLVDSKLVPQKKLEVVFTEAQKEKKDLGELLLEKKLIKAAAIRIKSVYRWNLTCRFN